MLTGAPGDRQPRRAAVLGQRALDHGQGHRPEFVVMHGRPQEAHGSPVELDRRARLGQLVRLAGQVQQHELARRLAEVVHAGHRLLPAVAALVQVHGLADEADLVRDRAVIGLEAQARAACLDAHGFEGPRAGRYGAGRVQPLEHRVGLCPRHDEVGRVGGRPGHPPHESAVRQCLGAPRAGSGSPAAVSTDATCGPTRLSTAQSGETSAGSTRLRKRIFCR